MTETPARVRIDTAALDEMSLEQAATKVNLMHIDLVQTTLDRGAAMGKALRYLQERRRREQGWGKWEQWRNQHLPNVSGRSDRVYRFLAGLDPAFRQSSAELGLSIDEVLKQERSKRPKRRRRAKSPEATTPVDPQPTEPVESDVVADDTAHHPAGDTSPPTSPSAGDLVPRALLDRALQALDALASEAVGPLDYCRYASEAAADIRRELGEPSPPKPPSPSPSTPPSPQPNGEGDVSPPRADDDQQDDEAPKPKMGPMRLGKPDRNPDPPGPKESLFMGLPDNEGTPEGRQFAMLRESLGENKRWVKGKLARIARRAGRGRGPKGPRKPREPVD
jgi:hypothetical protein